MRLLIALLIASFAGCSVVPYHSEFTRDGQKVDYKADREQCRTISRKKATEDAYGETTGDFWWQSVQKRMVECMNEKGYEWVKKE
jgi:hypothetical protein